MRDLDLPGGEERELVFNLDRVYDLNGEDGRTLAAVSAFRVVPEHDLAADRDPVEHLRYEGLVQTVDLGDYERGLALTREGRDLLDAHSLGREDEPVQALQGPRTGPRLELVLDLPTGGSAAPRRARRARGPACRP